MIIACLVSCILGIFKYHRERVKSGLCVPEHANALLQGELRI